MSRNSGTLSVAALCGLAMGCVPIPKKSVIHYGVQGRLTEVSSRVPIAKRHVSIAVDGREFDRKTNGRGEFKIAPEMQLFWTWLGGPMWMNATRATVVISLDGCIQYQRTFMVRTESPDVPAPPNQDRLRGSYIVLGDVEIKKCEPSAGGNAE